MKCVPVLVRQKHNRTSSTEEIIYHGIDYQGVRLVYVCTKGYCTLGPSPSVWITQVYLRVYINKF